MNWQVPLFLIVAKVWLLEGMMKPLVRIFFYFVAIVLSIIVWLLIWWIS